MKRIISVCLTMALVAGIAWAKVDFSKPAPVKIFEPLGTVNTRNTTNGNPNRVNMGNIASNVLPLSMEIDIENGKNGKTGHKSAICSAMRLTSTLVLTAAHCLEDFSHGQQIYAEPFITSDRRWGLYLLNNKKTQYAKFNATVFFYRPSYSSDGSAMSHAFDFALVKLDSHLVLNTNFIKQEINKALSNFPEVLRAQWQEQLTQTIYQEVNKTFGAAQKTYKQFLSASLEKFDLLQMDPDVVKEEMQNRTVRAYFWPVDETTGKRGPVKVFSGSVLGTDKANHKNTHTLLWNIHTEPGTSGSPVLDVQRKLVVSVTSGPIHGEAVHGGGLISAEVCQWVKSHDASVKCLAVYGGATYVETPKTANWGK